ncbi:family 16 glycosylhydrolase [Tenacibaculum agarivorans]|uniref:family 16 glycosylhydrolase n=1 Tax=Tenacibaculum agarivorans TaxID=1908389 RepID=UPI00094B928A|nr:family 16 glycosylhydrolase [Tenacibaculum agarivorans]
MFKKRYLFTFKISYLLVFSLLTISCTNNDNKPSQNSDTDDQTSKVFPLTDPNNSGNWVLNTSISDEFEGNKLNEDKWHIQGTNGVYVSNFVGRSPSQFSTDNVRVEDGMLKLETRWEPDYNFNPKVDKNGDPYENITTAAVISKSEFVYGYLEVKTKAADAEITSSFWATGNNTELDFFEMFGDHKQPHKLDKERELWWSIHDWTADGQGRTTYTEHHDLGFKVVDGFHIYGYEWSENGIKVYVDGQLLSEAPRDVINAYDDITNNNGGNGSKQNYVTTFPVRVWFDQETFPWHGVPNSKEEVGGDGSIDFEIEYIRVWQKQ